MTKIVGDPRKEDLYQSQYFGRCVRLVTMSYTLIAIALSTAITKCAWKTCFKANAAYEKYHFNLQHEIERSLGPPSMALMKCSLTLRSKGKLL